MTGSKTTTTVFALLIGFVLGAVTVHYWPEPVEPEPVAIFEVSPEGLDVLRKAREYAQAVRDAEAAALREASEERNRATDEYVKVCLAEREKNTKEAQRIEREAFAELSGDFSSMIRPDFEVNSMTVQQCRKEYWTMLENERLRERYMPDN